MASSLCGDKIGSRRALLAALWSLVTILTALAFLTALTFTLSARNLYNDNDDYQNYYNGEENPDEEEDNDPEVAVTSRAMAFAALWTAVLASLLTVFGSVVLGWQSPTGQYYTCCSSNVHRTTPLSLGSFIGALIMFANLTLVCSVLFGEFEIRDYQRDGAKEGEDNYSTRDTAMGRSSMAFSIMCMFLTVLYAGFAALTFSFSHSIIEEHLADEREEALHAAHHHHHHPNSLTPHHLHSSQFNPHNNFNNGYDGYIGERFDVHRSRGPGSGGVGFVPNGGDVATLT